MRPLREISAAVEEISASNLDRRVDLAATETELGVLARVLNSAFDRLEESIEKQVRFTADASHELRTPVSVILAQTSMARRRDRPIEDYRDVIETCHSAAARMKSLVEGLLMLARNDAGELRPRISDCDLRQLADECIDLLLPLAEEKEIAIRRELADVSVEADPELLAQAISNLVSNAIRHNGRGGEARVSLVAEGAEAVLTVSDNGPGIPPEDLPRIFDRFYRVDAARSRRDGGSGLGLSIARAVALSHGGTLSCESPAGQGARFTLRLPVNRAGGAPVSGA
jgi:heavy metal sensor kinase